jgi:hypothetical protein
MENKEPNKLAWGIGIVGAVALLGGGYTSQEYGPKDDVLKQIPEGSNISTLIGQIGAPYDSHPLDNGKVVYRWGYGKTTGILGYATKASKELRVVSNTEGSVVEKTYGDHGNFSGFGIINSLSDDPF